jgi:anaerobic magnesium-protoporphyrin IX monomethyl ester cyclase
MVLDLMPEEIGISVSYPLPGTKFYDKVKEQLKEKTNWTDSDELAMMYRSTFHAAYYKKLHRYVHKVYRKKYGLNSIKRMIANPFNLNKKVLRSALSIMYYIPASTIDSILLKKLEAVK